MTKMLLSSSEKIRHEYCCTVVRIGECFPIEGADRIQRTLVNGMDMVISKTIQPGDIMIYAANETALDTKFLSVNNLYDINNYALNSNHEEVQKLIDEGKKDEAKLLCGFFTKQSRTRLLKLKGTYSYGFLFSPEALVSYCPELDGTDFESLIDTDFDTVNGERFVKAYVPKTTQHRTPVSGGPRKNCFDRLIEENFKFHYDSLQLQREIGRIRPGDIVDVSVKMHGTSAIFARIECKIPAKLSLPVKAWNWLMEKLSLERMKIISYTVGQDNIFSSRTVIKNRYIDLKNPDRKVDDVWGWFNDIICPFIPDNTIIYGEIVGYFPGDGKCVQRDYDYGCEPGECRLMPYRIVRGSKELNVWEVNSWTETVISKNPKLAGRLMKMPVLYHGSLAVLYEDIPVDDKWHENVLAAMKKDITNFGMEQNEPMCSHKVPREGLCIRIEDDPIPENFKLKCSKFLDKESKSIDAGEVDIEMIQTDDNDQ